MRLIAAADVFAGKHKTRCLCSEVKSAVCFSGHFSVHLAKSSHTPSSHVLYCACFGRIRPKYVMRRAFLATFRRAENEEAGERGDKRQEGMPSEDRKKLEDSLNVERNRTHVSRETLSIIFFAKYSQFFSKRISLFAY